MTQACGKSSQPVDHTVIEPVAYATSSNFFSTGEPSWNLLPEIGDNNVGKFPRKAPVTSNKDGPPTVLVFFIFSTLASASFSAAWYCSFGPALPA
jgi:hypothetical protein